MVATFAVYYPGVLAYLKTLGGSERIGTEMGGHCLIGHHEEKVVHAWMFVQPGLFVFHCIASEPWVLGFSGFGPFCNIVATDAGCSKSYGLYQHTLTHYACP